MNEIELIKLLNKYILENPEFNKNIYRQRLDIKQPQVINYSDKLAYDENGKLKCAPFSVETFQQVITKAQDDIPFCMQEGIYVVPPQNGPRINFNFNGLETIPNLDQDIHKKVAVIKQEEVGHGLFVIAEEGLPKGTRICYSHIAAYRRNISLAVNIDPYIAYSEPVSNDVIELHTGLQIGGIARFIQYAPTAEELKNFTFKNYESSNVAVANTILKTERSKENQLHIFFETTEDLPYGAPLLCSWSYKYWLTAFHLFGTRIGLFDKRGYLIPFEHYLPPVQLNHGIRIPYATLESAVTLKFPASIPYIMDGIQKSMEITPNEAKSIMDYLTNAYHPIFHISEPKVDIWKSFFAQVNSFKPQPSPLNMRIVKLDTEFAEIEYAYKKAFEAKDYKAVIKLAKWLITQELSNAEKSIRHELVTSLLLNIGNAYAREGMPDEAVYLLGKSKEYDKSNAHSNKVDFVISSFQKQWDLYIPGL